MKVLSKSLAQTRKVAQNVLDKITQGKSAEVLALSGDLGSGKTAFTKELASLLKLPKQEVTSPTFVLMKIFDLKNQKFERLIHIDAYRIESDKELINLGWREMIRDSGNLILIEWPEKVRRIIPKKAKKIRFNFVDKKTREIIV